MIFQTILSVPKRAYEIAVRRYFRRVIVDGGTVRSLDLTDRYLEMCSDNDMLDSIQFAWLGGAGSKFRTSGINTFFTKLYTLLGGKDATQTTSTNQPYLSGNIAPNEKYGLKNPNGGSNFLTHTPISFSATDAWSVTFVVNTNSSNTTMIAFGDATNGNSGPNSVYLKLGLVNMFRLYNSSNQKLIDYTTNEFIGKNSIGHITADGTNCKLYINSLLKQTVSSIPTSFLFNGILRGYNSPLNAFFGKLSSYIIRSQALTQQQVTAEYNLLRSYIAEIENVVIGTQTWATSNCEMVATPRENIIQEMQASSSVEKIIDSGFDDATKWNTADVNGVVGSGSAIFDGTSTGVFNNIMGNQLTSGKWYKLTIKCNTISRLALTSSGGGLTWEGGTYTADYPIGETVLYLKSSSNFAAGLVVYAGFPVNLDTYSVKELGWADSQELYDGIYAQTAGTVEQKTYAAVKAAAMWCHYDNDVAKGAVYGKLYNWFAVKLLQMDIDYYNAANPTTPWGWRVPLKADFETLATSLGGSSVAGGKVKKEGITYWNSPNTGADNTSGISIIGAGFRATLGGFINLKDTSFLLTNDTTAIGSYGYYLSSGNTLLVPASYTYVVATSVGCSLRLIKN